MATGHISYDARTNSVSSYEPRFKAVDPSSFMDIVNTAIRQSIKAQALTQTRTFAGAGTTSGTLDQGTLAALGQLRTNAQVREIKKNGPESFFRGKKRSDLSPQLRRLYDQVEKQKKKGGIKSDLVGGLGRVLDVLSRFNYASAEAVDRVWSKSMESDGDSWLKNLGEAFVGAGEGWVSGFTGKSKTTFSHVVQHQLDSVNALQHGQDPSKAKYGSAHLGTTGKIAKGLLGFTLDVGLDPTTYLGVGVVKSALKPGAKAAAVATKQTDDLVEKMVKEYGIDAPVGFKGNVSEADRIGALKGYLGQNELLGDKAITHGAAQARSARLRDADTFVQTVKATVAAKETARFREILMAGRAADFKDVPKDIITESGPKFMDVPATAEDLAAYHRYTKIASDNARKRAGLKPGDPRLEILDREMKDAQAKFNDYFNVSDINVEALAKTNAHVKASAHIQHLDNEIRIARDAVRKIKARPKPDVPTLRRAEARLDDLVSKRETAFVNAMEDAAVKVAPDKGTLVSKLRRESDISIIRRLAAASDPNEVQAARRELAYRFNEKGDKWLNATVTKAAQHSDGLVEDLKNLTPLKRPARHTIKRRQIVKIEQPTKKVSKKEVAQATAHNARIMREVEKEAEAKALEIADGIEGQLVEIMARETTPQFKRGLSIRLNLLGTKKNSPETAKVMFALALPDAVTRTINKYVFRDTLKEGLTRWGNFFKSSAGTDPLLNSMRLSYNGAAGFRIEEHAKRLRNMWQGVNPAQRRAALRQWIRYGDKIDGAAAGPYAEMVRQIENEVNLISGVMRNSYPDGMTVGMADFNRWLPDSLKMQQLNSIDSGIQAGTSEWFRSVLRHVSEDADPAELLWHLNIAREKILTRMAMKDNIRQLFGVERNAQNETMTKRLIRDYGYKEVDELGPLHIFPPDIADDIRKTFDLMKNQKQVNDLIKFFDSVMTVYKSGVTMYNPGYHMRNSFGDGWMNYLAGVSGKQGLDSYREAGKTIKALKGVTDDNPIHAALMDINPKAAFAGIENKPNTVLFKRHGKDVTAEQVWVLYNHYGLHSGFVSNEFGTGFGRPGSVRSTGIGKAATGVNRSVQAMSEHREDFFRLAHFINAIKQSKNVNLDRAAFEASESVRKYLFDYSDFTQIEKSVMLRVFPFYKWTRKAIPLMAETLFAQPGKALMYPKAMRNISAAMGYDLGDSNGVIPASDVIIPEWVRQRGMYPVGEQNGNTVLADVALPFNDVVRTVSSPLDSVFQMLTPAVRIPVELKTGKRLYNDVPVGSKSEYAGASFPQGAFIQQMMKKRAAGEANGFAGTILDPRTIQFLTGVGLHENTDRQMQNELRGQSYQAAQAIKKRKGGKN